MSELEIRTNRGDDVTDAVRQVYDMAVSSMDYGSGFLSTQEYDTLAYLADVLDASDKLDVKAEARSQRYSTSMDEQHAYRADRDGLTSRCLTCGRPENAWPYQHPIAAKKQADVRRMQAQRRVEYNSYFYHGPVVQLSGSANPPIEELEGRS